MLGPHTASFTAKLPVLSGHPDSVSEIFFVQVYFTFSMNIFLKLNASHLHCSEISL